MFLVSVALAVLAVVPALLQRRLAPLREQAEAADEARALVTRVQFALAAETSALRDALLTPDSGLRIVGNLLCNAVKYTPAPGRIVLEARAVEAGRGPATAAGSSCACGTRVPESPGGAERIFDEFHRLHDGQAQGHGLGLATSRRIARLLGGDVTVGEAEGGGAAFSLWLPGSSRPDSVEG